MDATDWIETTDWVERERAPAAWLTVERAAYVAIGLLAGAVRLFDLGLRPLTGPEAAQALAAWQFTQGTIDMAPAGTIPALFTGNVAVFTLFGASDALARWLPALAGLVLALLPYALRHRLGRGGALAASFLLALSPTAVYFSRAVDGSILVAAAGLALVAGLLVYLDTLRPAALYAAAAALGVGLTAGPGMVTLVLILALYGVWLYASGRWLGRDSGWEAVRRGWSAASAVPGLPARLGLVLAAVFGAAATTFVLHPAGVGLAADLLGAWFRGLGPEPGGQPLSFPLLLIVRYEPLVLLFGILELLRAGLDRRAAPQDAGDTPAALSHTGLLGFWALAAGLLIVVAGHRPAGNLLLAVVPLALLAGEALARAWRWVARRAIWREAWAVAGVALAMVVFVYLQVTRYALVADASTVSFGGVTLTVGTGLLLLALLGLVLLAALAVIAWYWRGAALLVAAGWLVAVTLLVLFGFRVMWSASLAHAADPREPLNVRPTAPDVRRFVADLHSLSESRTGDIHTLPVAVETSTGPVVAWYLRDFTRQTALGSLAEEALPPEALAAVGLRAEGPLPGEKFVGQTYPLETAWSAAGLGIQGLIRWFVVNEASPPVVEREVVLWSATRQ